MSTGKRRRYSFLVPDPPVLSRNVRALRRLEASHWFTNFGPYTRQFESALVRDLFGGSGHCTTVANATLGLILAAKTTMLRAFGRAPAGLRTLGVVPSFTFPATAQVLEWLGLTPRFLDIDPLTWLPDRGALEKMLAKSASRIALIIPYATFGNNLDLDWYEAVHERFGIPVVVDAAASCGSRLDDGRHFGQSSSLPVVFSLHATKLFATSEGGVVYSADAGLIRSIREMSNFGMDNDRRVTLPGLNAKMNEVTALQALLKLRDLKRLVRRRSQRVARYRRNLPEFHFQHAEGSPAFAFCPADTRLSREQRDALIVEAARKGVEIRKYYDPPLHRQPWFSSSKPQPLPVTEALSDSIITLPLYDSLDNEDIDAISRVVRAALARVR